MKPLLGKPFAWLPGLRVFVWLYLALLCGLWLLIYTSGESWWFATLILFGPRWVSALPLVVLVPAAARWRRRLLCPLALSAVLVVWPIMGYCVPLGRPTAPDGPKLRILTCNCKGHCDNNVVLNDFIRTSAADIVALQGCWWPTQITWPEGWHVYQHGEMLVASHFPLRPVSELMHTLPAEEFVPPPNVPEAADALARLHILGCMVSTPQGELCFCTVHPPSPRYGIKPMLSRETVLRPSASSSLTAEIGNRWQVYAEMSRWLHDGGDPQIIAGDFNLPPDSPIYRKYWGSYWNAFSAAGLGFGYTEWPRLPIIRFGVRIDHILSGPNWQPVRCWLGPDIGSDHLPLVADLLWTAKK